MIEHVTFEKARDEWGFETGPEQLARQMSEQAKADTEAAAMQKGKEPAAGNRRKGKGSKKK